MVVERIHVLASGRGQREQRESTRREILAAADGFLRERPYRELSVEVVMTQTGLTRTAFYRHFDDATDLVLRLLAELGSELFSVAERWRRSADAGHATTAHESLGDVVDFFVRHGPLVRAMADAAATDEQIERGYRTTLDGFVELTTRALDGLVETGEIVVPDTRALALALNLMNQAYLLEEFGREPVGDPQIALATLEMVWLRVVGTPGARLADRAAGPYNPRDPAQLAQ